MIRNPPSATQAEGGFFSSRTFLRRAAASGLTFPSAGAIFRASLKLQSNEYHIAD
jgi:hypothetical protein